MTQSPVNHLKRGGGCQFDSPSGLQSAKHAWRGGRTADLQQETGLALADFDVLAQLAEAHGELRMTELADRALISRSGMSRRVARLVDEGLLRRARAGTDGRGVVVALTEAGIARLGETAPVHARGISKLFVAQLDDQELALLERALNKVIVDCSFG